MAAVEPAEAEYVRVCPVCEAENAPERARCTCGASLAGVDFSLRRPTPPPAAAETANVLIPAVAEAEVHAAPLLCPHADCAQPNPPQNTRCAYCNRLLRTAPANVAASRPLPSGLRERFSVVDAFPAAGSEADLLLVSENATGARCVAKLYRKGLEPDLRLLDVLACTDDPHLVRIIAHGASDGVAYEVQEYLEHGTLRDVLAAGPLTRENQRRIVSELAAALETVHAQRILHRDLKPENVLVRTPSPLALALTDFGIASLREATQHFTGGARTARYAAPEALTGVIDDKADWWALGMIVLEAASGAHPYDGLNEQVVNHRLATQPVDVRGVYDEAFRLLCRGLLLRDPRRRWGGAEVKRWLAGDASLQVAENADAISPVQHPYRLGQGECTTASELASAAARYWPRAARDLARGQIARWLEHELHDYDLARQAHDLAEDRAASDDLKLLRFLLLAAPDLPPIWRGEPAGAEAILAAAAKADGGDEAATGWLDSIAREGVLARLAGGDRALESLDRRWREGWLRFVDLWKATREAEEAWRKQPRAVFGATSATVTSFDDLMFSAPAWLSPPPQHAVNGALLRALHDEPYVEAMRADVRATQAEVADRCPWYDTLCARAVDDPVAALVAHRLREHARDDAAMERRREDGAQGARSRVVAEARDQLRARLDEVARIVAMRPGLDEPMIRLLEEALAAFLEECHHASTLGFADPDYVVLCRAIDKLSQHAFAAQRALGRCEEVQGFNAVFLRPERLAMAGVGLVATLALRTPVILFLGIVIAACFFGYRWYVALDATEAALAALRLLRLHGKSLLQPPAEDAPAL